jgi:hypothetical protein
MSSVIQRGNIRDDKSKKGIDSIIDFQYMGSVEFEDYALNESLVRIRKDHILYGYHNVIIGINSIIVYCKNKDINNIITFLIEISKSKIRLQEFSDFDNFTNDPENCTTSFWWDIGDDFMFWKNSRKFKKKFKEKIIKEK